MQRIFALQSRSLLLQATIILERLSGFCVEYRLEEHVPKDSEFRLLLLCDIKMNLEVPSVLPRMLLIFVACAVHGLATRALGCGTFCC